LTTHRRGPEVKRKCVKRNGKKKIGTKKRILKRKNGKAKRNPHFHVLSLSKTF
jgi:hypothetical protein